MKSGHVYVISNIGSFGENVFKVGMTQRIEGDEPWMERVRELGDASVPFPFDVHLVIYAEDAQGLERDFHSALRQYQVNKLNPRKEFFRINLDAIIQVLKEHHGEVKHLADPEALEALRRRSSSGVELIRYFVEPREYAAYREQVQNMTAEDREFLEQVQLGSDEPGAASHSE